MFMRTIIQKCIEVMLVHQKDFQVVLQMEHIGRHNFIIVSNVWSILIFIVTLFTKNLDIILKFKQKKYIFIFIYFFCKIKLIKLN